MGSYDRPTYQIRRERTDNNRAITASTSVSKFLYFQKARVKKVHALVITAGTNAAAGVDLYNGTTSVGEITLGTNTAGYVGASATLNAEIAAGSFLDVRGKANSSTLVVSLTVEDHVLPDAVETT